VKVETASYSNIFKKQIEIIPYNTKINSVEIGFLQSILGLKFPIIEAKLVMGKHHLSVIRGLGCRRNYSQKSLRKVYSLSVCMVGSIGLLIKVKTGCLITQGCGRLVTHLC
jgi:hypothetical protein